MQFLPFAPLVATGEVSTHSLTYLVKRQEYSIDLNQTNLIRT